MRTVKRIVCVVLSLLFVLPIMVEQEKATAASSQKYISEIAFAETFRWNSSANTCKNKLKNAGYTVIDHDLNSDKNYDFVHHFLGGTVVVPDEDIAYIYAGYKTTTNPDLAIRDIRFVHFWEPASVASSIYLTINGKKVKYSLVGSASEPVSVDDDIVDLNHGVGGDFIYCYITRDSSVGDPLVSISVSSNISVSGYTVCKRTDSDSASELNSGAGGDYVYMHYKTAPVKIIPVEYNFNSDRWYFSNITEKISIDYYIGMFKEAKGTELYNFRGEKSAHGHCFGMSVSTAATLLNAPRVTDYYAWNGPLYTKLSSVNKGTLNKDMNITAKDYIKYCHVYQDSCPVSWQRQESSYLGIENVYNAVKSAAQNNKKSTGIVVDFDGGPGRHTVYAIGVEGTDILVNDSNAPGTIQKIKVNGNNWTYSAGGYFWDSKVNATIGYVDYNSCTDPYMRLVYKINIPSPDVPGDNSGLGVYTEESELNGTESIISSYIEPIDLDKLLIVAENNNFSFAEADTMYKLMPTTGIDEGAIETATSLYWLGSGNSIKAENIGDETSELKLVGEDNKITIEVPQNTVADMQIEDNGESEVFFDTDEEEAIKVTFTTYGEDVSSTIIYGVANGTEVSAKETAEGIIISGLNGITVKYEADDEAFETEIKETDGATINITVNDEKDVIETDWTCKHINDDNDNFCDNCGAVVKEENSENKCSHLCHSTNEFLKFIWEIVNFFSMLFGMNPVCSCGAAHY